MKEEKILATAKKIARINKKAGNLLFQVFNDERLYEKMVSSGLKTVTDELEGVYEEDPYIFLWAVKKFMDEKRPFIKDVCRNKVFVYTKKFFNLLWSAKNLKYVDKGEENIKEITFLKIVNYEYDNKYGYRANYLFECIIGKNEELMNLLIDYGADVNQPIGSSRETLLMTAIRRYDVSLFVDLRYRKGANIYAQDKLGNTALHLALEIMSFRLSYDPDLLASIEKKLEYKMIKIIKLLLRDDYAIIPNNEGKTAYDIAKEAGLTEIVKIMESKFFDQKLTNVEVTPAKSMDNLPTATKSFISR